MNQIFPFDFDNPAFALNRLNGIFYAILTPSHPMIAFAFG
jgi:hypothetical protein